MTGPKPLKLFINPSFFQSTLLSLLSDSSISSCVLSTYNFKEFAKLDQPNTVCTHVHRKQQAMLEIHTWLCHFAFPSTQSLRQLLGADSLLGRSSKEAKLRFREN